MNGYKSKEEEAMDLIVAYHGLRRTVEEALKILGTSPDASGILVAVLLLTKELEKGKPIESGKMIRV